MSGGRRRTNVVLKTASNPGKEVPGGICSIVFHRLEWVYNISDRFGHLFLLYSPMGMNKKSFWKRETKSHKHCGEV